MAWDMGGGMATRRTSGQRRVQYNFKAPTQERLAAVTKFPHLPYRIGITGTIASGKSLVGSFLEEAGVPVLDTDKVVADLYQHDTALKQQLADAFGAAILGTNGNIQ